MGKFSQRDQFYTPAPLFLRGQIFEEEDSFRGRRNCVDQNSPLIHPFHTDVLNVFEQNLGKVLLADDVLKLSGDNCLKMTAKITTFLNEHVPLGGRVAVLFPPSAMQGLSILSVISSGRVPVILNHWMDHHEVERLSQLRNFHAVIHGEIIKRPEIDDLPSMRFSLGGKLESVFKTDNKRAVPLPHPETAVVLFTSGSMGEPKAVALSKNGLSYIISTLIKYFQLGADSHAIITLPIFHTMALNTHFFPTFFAGGTCTFVNTELSMGKIYRSIIESGGNFVALIGDMLKLCLKEKKMRSVLGGEQVKNIQMSGGITRVEHLSMAKELFPNAIIHKGFGLTELIRICMINSNDEAFYDETVGRVLPGQKVVIKDEFGMPISHGEVGEIFVKGPNLMIGYEGVSSQHQPFDQEGYLATGDYGYLTEDQRLYFKGRIDGTFKSQGRKISCMEIEQSALNHPSVTAAKCFAIECQVKGLRPLLVIEVRQEQLMEFWEEGKCQFERILMENLESYKIPKDVLILPRMPRLPNNKLCNRTLKNLVREEDSERIYCKAPIGMKFSLQKKDLN